VKKCISIKNLISYAVCAGIKDVENRTWKTDYRGELYIHSSGNIDYADFDTLSMFHTPAAAEELQKFLIDKNPQGNLKSYPASIQKFVDFIDFVAKWEDKTRQKYVFYSQAIIGKVMLVDIVQDSKSIFAIDGQYHWILANAELFENPILYVKGKLRLFDLNL